MAVGMFSRYLRACVVLQVFYYYLLPKINLLAMIAADLTSSDFVEEKRGNSDMFVVSVTRAGQ
jgi:hypothetical protein